MGINKTIFGELIQTIPAMYPKLTFNNILVQQCMAEYHNVHVSMNGVVTTDSFDTITKMVKYDHISFNVPGWHSERYVYNSTPIYNPNIQRQRTLHKGNIFVRKTKSNKRIHDESFLVPDNREPMQWYVRWDDVPYFVGVPIELIQSTKDMFPSMLAGWLEDLADDYANVGNHVFAEQYRHGVRLLQTAIENE